MPHESITAVPIGSRQPHCDSSDSGARKGAMIVRRWVIAFLIAAVVFYQPLHDLIRFAANSQLYSHVLLIPAICFYLIWTNRQTLPVGKRSVAASLIAYVPALILIGLFFANPTAAFWKVKSNYLSVFTTAMMLTCIGNLFLLLGTDFVRAALFPTLFLLTTAPFPETVLDGLEIFFQHSSAWTAGIMFEITNTTMLHDGLLFQLPGITLRVAQECSGIHSSLVLILTSLIAGYFFFNTYTCRTLLAFIVISLAIVRNAFRIFVIGQLCVHVSPDMINSSIHHHGGPIFFVISLVPFFILLQYLRKLDRRMSAQSKTTAAVAV
jgi:exosortase C (VPDSG-CTERM-specific)